MLADDKIIYDKADLELMTTYQLREICRKNKIINGVVDPLDKEELVRIILRSFGRQEEFLIMESGREGMERLQALFSSCRMLWQDVENLRCNSILTAYHGLAIKQADAYTIPYRKQFAGTNGFCDVREREAVHCSSYRGKTGGYRKTVSDKAVRCGSVRGGTEGICPILCG